MRARVVELNVSLFAYTKPLRCLKHGPYDNLCVCVCVLVCVWGVVGCEFIPIRSVLCDVHTCEEMQHSVGGCVDVSVPRKEKRR